jgi:hypothetical protein
MYLGRENVGLLSVEPEDDFNLVLSSVPVIWWDNGNYEEIDC